MANLSIVYARGRLLYLWPNWTEEKIHSPITASGFRWLTQKSVRLCPVVSPMKRLEIVNMVRTSKGGGEDMINFPTMFLRRPVVIERNE